MCLSTRYLWGHHSGFFKAQLCTIVLPLIFCTLMLAQLLPRRLHWMFWLKPCVNVNVQDKAFGFHSIKALFFFCRHFPSENTASFVAVHTNHETRKWLQTLKKSDQLLYWQSGVCPPPLNLTSPLASPSSDSEEESAIREGGRERPWWGDGEGVLVSSSLSTPGTRSEAGTHGWRHGHGRNKETAVRTGQYSKTTLQW